MIDLILKVHEKNQASVKIEDKPKEGKTFTEILAETKLTAQECNCVLDKLVKSGDLEIATYTSGVTACGDAIKSSVYVPKGTVTAVKK